MYQNHFHLKSIILFCFVVPKILQEYKVLNWMQFLSSVHLCSFLYLIITLFPLNQIMIMLLLVWTGSLCDNPSYSLACVNGTCVEDGISNATLCECDQGFGGELCDTSSALCDTNPCNNGGTCIKTNTDLTGTICYCVAGKFIPLIYMYMRLHDQSISYWNNRNAIETTVIGSMTHLYDLWERGGSWKWWRSLQRQETINNEFITIVQHLIDKVTIFF